MRRETSLASCSCQDFFPDIKSALLAYLLATPMPFFKARIKKTISPFPKSILRISIPKKLLYGIDIIKLYFKDSGRRTLPGGFIFYHICCSNDNKLPKKL
jgi:hypothetical protein